MTPSTIAELDTWLTENCYNGSYAIGKRTGGNGFGLHKSGNRFAWYFVERGQRQDLAYFQTEKEAVAFAFDRITADTWANQHLICLVNDTKTEFELLRALKSRNIHYRTDGLSGGFTQGGSYQVFVTGCDIKLVMDLKNRFGNTF